MPEDPWRDPAAGAALGNPALAAPAPQAAGAERGKLGVRDVLFGGRVAYRALAILAAIALVIGLAGGWVALQRRSTGKRTPERLLEHRVGRLVAGGELSLVAVFLWRRALRHE
jgi:hypothetical protein